MKRVLPAILILACSASAHAWTRSSDERIALKAAQLAPNDLRMLLEHFEPDYKRGLMDAQADEGTEGHRYFVLSRQGRLRERIERETRAAISAVRTGRPMRDVIYRLGVLAHFVADANNPFHIANDDPRLAPSQIDFETYFEQSLSKFPTVFYGLDENFTLTSYLDQTFSRTASFYPLMSEEYFRFGERRTYADFDDRSTAFGVASICYSRAVTDLVNLYFYVWGGAGGDVRRAPLLRGGNLLLNAN